MRWSIAVVLIGLTGCQAIGEDSRICSTPPALTVPTDRPGSARQDAEDCVHRWAYRLAGAPDSAREVADATVGGCETPIERYRREFTEGRLAPLDMEARRRLNAETTAEDAQFLGDIFKATALFHVVQARAGKCKVP